LGTDARASTPGTTGDEAGDEPPLRLRGDEAELFLAFNDDLIRIVRSRVYAHPADIEDACAFAWVQFMRYQPDRDRRWQAWLIRTAKREAWRLNALRPELTFTYYGDPALGTIPEPEDPRDRLEERLEFQAALEELRKLPPRLQEVVLIRSQVSRHRDVAEIMGVNTARVGQLLQNVGVALQELAERRHEADRPVASPRAARLRELQDHPPAWLVNTIGRIPGRHKSASNVVLAWRRAALALDDYRHLTGWNSRTEGLGPEPAEPAAYRAHQRAFRALVQLHDERARRHGISREQ
jgi:DNA-directed RNA polymerase specialized sigma24 family protein